MEIDMMLHKKKKLAVEDDELEVLNLIKNKQVDLFEIKRNDDYVAYNYEVVLSERFLTEAEFEKIKRLYKE